MSCILTKKSKRLFHIFAQSRSVRKVLNLDFIKAQNMEQPVCFSFMFSNGVFEIHAHKQQKCLPRKASYSTFKTCKEATLKYFFSRHSK